MKIKLIVSAIFLSGIGCSAAHAGDTPYSYTAQNLLDPNYFAGNQVAPKGYYSASGFIDRGVSAAVNNSGMVVGTISTTGGFRGFIADSVGHVFTDITNAPPPSAGITGNAMVGINNRGQSAGNLFWPVYDKSPDYGSKAVIYNADGSSNIINTQSPYGDLAKINAMAINDTAQVVGYDGSGLGAIGYFLTGPDGLGITPINVNGRAVNNNGQVAGYIQPDPNQAASRHAAITGPDGNGVSDLGTLGGTYSEAYGINNSGQVVGAASLPGDTASHAFITGPNGVGIIDLGTLGGAGSYATGINNIGQVVGYSQVAEGRWDPFVTSANGSEMYDLNNLVIKAVLNGPSEKISINDVGQIAGAGNLLDPSGNGVMSVSGFPLLLTPFAPVPLPTSFNLFLGAISFIGSLYGFKNFLREN